MMAIIKYKLKIISFLDILQIFDILISDHAQICLRGAGCIRLRVDLVVLTREPDTVSTVGGKDA